MRKQEMAQATLRAQAAAREALDATKPLRAEIDSLRSSLATAIEERDRARAQLAQQVEHHAAHRRELTAERDAAIERAEKAEAHRREDAEHIEELMRDRDEMWQAVQATRATEAIATTKLRVATEALERIAEFGNDLRQPSPQRIARTALDSETKGAPAIHGHTFTACGPECATQQEGR